MGSEASQQKAKKITNATARTVFLDFVESAEAQPAEMKNGSHYKRLLKAFYKSCKAQSPNTTYLSLVITGKNVGPQFISIGLNFLKTYSMISKLSLRASSLTKTECVPLARFIKSSTTIRELDVSENKIGDAGACEILGACVGHRRLVALLMDQVGTTDEVTESVVKLLNPDSKLSVLRLAPTQFSAGSLVSIATAIKKNSHITEFAYEVGGGLQGDVARTLKRNNQIQNIVNEIIATPWMRTFKQRDMLFKSIKGRRMVQGKAEQKEALRGTQLFEMMCQSEKKAEAMEPKSHALTTGMLRLGAAETIGRRDLMEDYTVIQQDFLKPGNLLVGLFDGHGGREASEHVGSTIAQVLKQHQAKKPADAFTAALKEIHESMQPWCVYVGTTACVGYVTVNHAVIANLGDTRCVLVQKGKAERLTVDHKPDIPEEKAFIEQNGGYVEQGRVNGVLGCSRSLGDGFLGKAINCTPSVCERDLTGSWSLVFACDGLWDVITDQEVAAIVTEEIDPSLAAKRLREQASDRGSTDNISIIVVSAVVAEKDE